MAPAHANPPLKVLSLTRRPDSASYQLRVLDFLDALAKRGLAVTCRTIPKDRAGQRALRREMGEADVVWWHRYLISPWALGPWRRAARKLVFDFDDAICFASRGSSWTRKMKFRHLLSRCEAALTGSDYLAELARPHCPDVRVIPMAIDPPSPTDLPARAEPTGPVQLLWLGGKSTLRYLDAIAEPLRAVGAARPDVTLRLVTHEARDFGPLRVDFRPWSPQEQDRALRECDVGLCPMPDTVWTCGKCPYKVLQYMAWRMPWVGSAVGENVRLAGEAEHATGLLVGEGDDWPGKIGQLIDEPKLRSRLGQSGRAFVEAHRSRDRVADLLAGSFRQIAGA